MKRILCSTGALIGRPNGRDFTLLTGLEDKLECDGFELLMYDDWYEKADELAETMNSMKKPFPVFHIEKTVGDLISRNGAGDTETALELFTQNCDIASRTGAEKLVLHLWSGIDSDKDMPHNTEIYRQLREISDSSGLLLTVENVVCNNLDPMTNMKTLSAASPDACFTFDTKMAEFHGQLMDITLDENRPLWDNVIHLHVNDYKGGIKDWSCLNTLHPGDGQIDFGRFFDFVRQTGYTGDITVESTSFDKTGRIDIEKINRSLLTVRELYGLQKI